MSPDVGRFIVVEGIDGSGKTTQVSQLARSLREEGRIVLETTSPTSWYRNQPAVRDYINDGIATISANSLAALAAADRMMDLERTIIPALASRNDVVCARYIYSALAYSRQRGADMSFVESVNALALRSTHGVLLRLPPECVVARVSERGGVRTFEERADYLNEVQDEMLRRWPSDFLVLDATRSISSLSADILAYVNA